LVWQLDEQVVGAQARDAPKHADAEELVAYPMARWRPANSSHVCCASLLEIGEVSTTAGDVNNRLDLLSMI
jgi:hypothetical protein